MTRSQYSAMAGIRCKSQPERIRLMLFLTASPYWFHTGSIRSY